MQVFQSTHPRRVRRVRCEHTLKGSCFNPRTHVGCDSPRQPQRLPQACFNPRTHVGCDLMPFGAWLLMACFNPRTHVGCDLTFYTHGDVTAEFQSTHPRRVRLYCGVQFVSILEFQSTHPRRVRRMATQPTRASHSFNPRTHVGCDVSERYRHFNAGVSIHAPT